MATTPTQHPTSGEGIVHPRPSFVNTTTGSESTMTQHTTGNRKEAEIKTKLIYDMYMKKTESYKLVRDIAILFNIFIICIGLIIVFVD